ncbi:TCR/Tet family MFS transporter [Rhizobium hainanense]|uniref:MFS transporter, DHA1 family, tetracycline resistance protein n=1 Tax=Rhizobium hainanense TaxID=52131 RepID=A0A1C3V1W0_9HYPH|nr:TCR/Tet family MFS transporter [Rhizobium hainanense]SCB21721.1 MFS transporter, DHA1 family, tetracycline resistance protein [Rhizobium hainanense]
MNKMLLTILAVVVLDAAGTGLVMPILPKLLKSVAHSSELGWRYGAFLSLYAALQFLASPVLGTLSDRYGRRPVLLISLAGGVIDYAFMAWAPGFWWLFLGRAVAGLTAANAAVATACLADITPEERRTRAFGLLSACFGIGFILGPVIGGVLGTISLRAPFVAAAFLVMVNFIVALVVLPETRTVKPERIDPAAFHPLAPLRWIGAFPPLLFMSVLLAIVGEVGGTVWVLYGQDKFGWDTATVGLSLAGFGLFHALAQAFVAGPLSERWGERCALVVAIACDGAAYVAIAFVTQGFLVFLLFPLFCLGGIGQPALQSLMTQRVGADEQGRLQGVLISLTSLASMIAPLAISEIYFASRHVFPGLVWVIGAALYLLCVPVLFANRKRADGPLEGTAHRQGEQP